MKRISIAPTYDSRETGDRYTVTSKVNGKPVAWQERIPDPFVRHTVYVAWRDLLSALIRRRGLVVTVLVDGDREVVEDVLELDGNYLGQGCTRRDEWNAEISQAISKVSREP